MLAYMDYIMLYSLLMGHSLDDQRVWYVGMVFWNPPVEKGAKHPINIPSFSWAFYHLGGVRRPLPGVPPMPHRCGPWCKWRPRRGCRWGRLGRDGSLFEKGNETCELGSWMVLYGFIKALYALYTCLYVVLAPDGHRSRDMVIISY